MTEQLDRYDVVVVGGGPGGYATALRAAGHGLRVAIVEADRVGGTCLHRGCVPSKALLHVAHLADQVPDLVKLGLAEPRGALDVAEAGRFRDGIVGQLHRGLEGLLRARAIDVVAGWGRVVAPGEVVVDGTDARRIRARHVVVATGSVPDDLPGVVPDGERVLRSDDALRLDRVPGSAVVVGAGAVGVELASLWRSLGTDVTVVEAADRLLPLEDPDSSAALARAFARRGMAVRTATALAGVTARDDDVVVELGDGTSLAVDQLLVAVGRRPATAGTGLERRSGDLTGLCIAIEEIARVDQSLAITLEAGVGLGAAPIARFGTEEQQARWLPDLCAGRALGGFGLTEPDAGSDAGGTRTTAALDPATGEWVIDGGKAFITNSGTPITSIVTVTARTGAGELSAIVVPAGTPGLEVQPAYRKLGWHASDTHGLTFSGCRVPADHLLGERGRGFAQFLEILDEGRVAIAALAVGVIQRCLDDAATYAIDRVAFGRPIGANQGVAFRVADLQVALDAARSLTYRAAWLRDSGRPFKREAAVAKLYATEAAVSATRSATQVFGGYGFMDETAVARHYRDAKILEIGEGTSEVQRLVISRELGLPVR